MDAPLTGLTSAEAAARAARGLTNQVGRGSSRSIAGILRSNLASVFNLAVFGIASVLGGLYVGSGDVRTLYDAVTISAVALVNSVIGVLQELRAKRALDRISALARSTVTVLRDGRPVEVQQDAVVQGDLVQVIRGDQIPVDGSMVAAAHCEVDESLVTGESAGIDKPVGARVLSGSFCVAGQGVLLAETVGEACFIQRTTREAKTPVRLLSPLQTAIDRVVAILMAAAALVALLLVARAYAGARQGSVGASGHLEVIIDTARAVAALVTSMVPVGLVLLSTVAFSLGVLRISRKGALVQRLNAVESFSHVDVLCMDKTGTLTRNELRLVALAPAAGEDEASLRALGGAFVHRCAERNSTVQALQAATPPPGADATVLDEVPFNSRDKWSGLHLRLDGVSRLLVLGACDVLEARLDARQREQAREVIAGAPGLRHVLLAEAIGPGAALATSPLRLCGVLSLADEIRSDAPAVLTRFAARGIALKIFSGDGAETVRAVALAAGWGAGSVAGAGWGAGAGAGAGPGERPHRVVTGPELDAMSPEELAAAARGQSLFARVSPENKRSLVAELQRQGRYVAMVGDGVNDVPALKKANLGVAMGAGSRMARDVADLVLLQNDFALLPEVLAEGATIVANVQASAKLFLTKNVFSAALILTTGFLALTFPFVPRHVSVLNFFAITVPALLVTGSRRIAGVSGVSGAGHQLRQPERRQKPRRERRKDRQRDVLGGSLRFAGISGSLIALGGLASYYASLVLLEVPVERARTVLLTELVLLTALNFLLVLSGTDIRAALRRHSVLLLLPVAFTAVYLALLLAVTQTDALSALASFLELVALGPRELALSFGVASLTGVCMVRAIRSV